MSLPHQAIHDCSRNSVSRQALVCRRGGELRCSGLRARRRCSVRVRSGLYGLEQAANLAATSAAVDVVPALAPKAGPMGLMPALTHANVASILQSVQELLNVPAATLAKSLGSEVAGAAHHVAQHILPAAADAVSPHAAAASAQAVLAGGEVASFAAAAAADGATAASAAAGLAPNVHALLQPALAELAAAADGGAAAAAAAASASPPGAHLLHGLASWAGDQLAGAAAASPGAATSLAASLARVVSAASGALEAEALRAETQRLTAGLVLGVQQLVTVLHAPAAGGAAAAAGGASSLTAMAAAQEALAAGAAGAASARAVSEGGAALDGLTQLSVAVVALAAAALPRRSAAAASAEGGGGGADGAGGGELDGDERPPCCYDPDALGAYWSKHPVQVMRRNAVILSRLSTFLAAILTDWRLGRWEALMPQRAVQARQALESMGPAWIKIGQALSTRVDILPEVYLAELAQLQANVAPFSTVEVLEDSLGCSVDSVFEWLSEDPLASASLGQVYKGQLRPEWGGEVVAVKVQRPGALEAVGLDVFIVRRAAQLMARLPGVSEEWAGVVDEWAGRLYDEMDYLREAAHTEAFRAHMAGLEGVVVAQVNAQLSSRKVLVMSWVEGEKLSESSEEEITALLPTLLNCYLIQLLETGFLHADPHPGNLLRSPDGKLVILDFGLVTEVSESQRVALVEFITHLTLEDWSAVAGDLVTLGFLPDGLPQEDEDGQAQMAEVLQRVMGQLVRGGGIRNGINVFSLATELRGVARTHRLVVPPYFTLVLRAFSTIEGIALKVSPSYSIVSSCMPYLSRRLLSDANPRMRAALRAMLYGGRARVDVERLQRLAAAFSSFTTDPRSGTPGPPSSSGGLNPSFALAAAGGGERVKGGRPWQPQAALGFGALMPGGGDGGGGGGAAAGSPAPAVHAAVKEALRVVFSREGAYAQELIVEELVAGVDALSREALAEALGMLAGSAGALAALRGADALGPLRALLLPLPPPVEALAAAAPTVKLTEEDQQALASIRMLLAMLAPPATGPSGWGPSAVAAGGGQAVRAAAELLPLVPEILPGVQNFMDLFLRQLLRRMAIRLAEELGPSSSSLAPPSTYPPASPAPRQQLPTGPLQLPGYGAGFGAAAAPPIQIQPQLSYQLASHRAAPKPGRGRPGGAAAAAPVNAPRSAVYRPPPQAPAPGAAVQPRGGARWM